MNDGEHLEVRFFCTDNGNEPVRDWLKSLPIEQRKLIGEDIKTVQFGWPLGMPLVRPMGDGLFEIRTTLKNTISRILICFSDNKIILLHGFIKKTQKCPANDFDIAKRRKKLI